MGGLLLRWLLRWAVLTALLVAVRVVGVDPAGKDSTVGVDNSSILVLSLLEDVYALAPYVQLSLIDRNLDFTSRILRETIGYHITAEAGSPKPIDHIYITNALDAIKLQHMLEVDVTSKTHTEDELNVKNIIFVPAVPRLLKVVHPRHPLPTPQGSVGVRPGIAGVVLKFNRSLHVGEQIVLGTSFARAHSYTPSKPHISLDDKHRVYIDVPAVYQTAYRADSQLLSLNMPAEAEVEIPATEYEIDDSSEGRRLKLPQHTNVEPYAAGADVEKYRVTFEFKSHLGYFKKMQRTVVLSNFDSVQIREEHDFVNDASALNSEYPRAALSKMSGHQFGSLPPNQRVDPSPVALFIPTVVPRTAFGLQFYDIIGNVSSSFVNDMDQYLIWNLWPRFPVLGGWSANWSIEYHVPSQMRTDPHTGVHALKLLSFPPIPDTCTDELELRIVLPSGARNGNVILPREQFVATSRKERRWGWLDIIWPREMHVFNLRSVCSPRDYVLNSELIIIYEGGGIVTEYTKAVTLSALLAILSIIIFALFRFLWHGSRLPSLEERSVARSAELLLEVVESAIMESRKYLQVAESIATREAPEKVMDDLIKSYKITTGIQFEDLDEITTGLPNAVEVAASLKKLHDTYSELFKSSPNGIQTTAPSMRSTISTLEEGLVLAATEYERVVASGPQFLWNKKQT
eukprot:Lankesteria_metandrocarpae@DN3888_c0_g1_i1.p1